MNNIPEIRFPEFKNDGEWKEKKLSQIGGLVNGLTYSPNDVSSEGTLVLRSSNIKDNRIIFDDNVYVTLNVNEENLSMPGDILICVRNGSKSLIGKNALIKEKLHDTTHGAFMTVFRTKNFNFVHQLFKSELYYKYVHSDLGATINSINGKNLLNYKFHFPQKPKEQEKVADCLSSLDEVIEGYEAKLKVIKNHKKGLIQNLFPEEGKTMPVFRFPEFKNDGNWKVFDLGSNLTKQPEYGINAPAVPFSTELPTYIRITDISTDGRFLSREKVSVDRIVNKSNYLLEGDIVLARTGASVGKSYKYRYSDGKLVFAGFLIRIRPDENKLNSEFLFQFLSTDQFWKWVSLTSARSGQPGINGTEYSSMPIYLPPNKEEQLKIAECLSSLDNLINEYSNKIEQLNLHKVGLMQGLFPKKDN